MSAITPKPIFVPGILRGFLNFTKRIPEHYLQTARVSGYLQLCRQYHHNHHIHEGLGVFPVPWSSKWSWSLHLFFGRPMFLLPFGLYCSACFGILFVSILCTCCSHFFWYCFISFTMFCAPVCSLIRWFFSLSNFVIPSKCLRARGSLVVKALRYKPAGHGFDSRWCHWNFSVI